MTDKKVHWKTAEKLAKESANVAPESVAVYPELTEFWAPSPVDIVAPKANKAEQYRVFDARMNTVAQVYSLAEAEKELTRFAGGKIVKL